MFLYETHLHTFPVSRCAKATVEETIAFYKSKLYDGVFITNHFLDGNINIDKSLPYEQKIEFYFSDYEKALAIGKELEFKVFCGVEMSYKGTDFLVYGLDKAWFLAHPEIMDMKMSQKLTFLMDSGALVIQAHPFREASYIDHIRLFPRCVHGVEVMNSCSKYEEDLMAHDYAKSYDLIPFAGSDNHRAGGQRYLAGIRSDTPINSVAEFIHLVKTGETTNFIAHNPFPTP